MSGPRTARTGPPATRRLGLGIVLAALSAPACTGPKSAGVLPQVWAQSASVGVGAADPPREKTACFDRKTAAIRLVGAAGETVAFELALSATGGPCSGIQIEVDDLVADVGVVSRDCVRMYRHVSVAVERFDNWYLKTCGPAGRRDVADVLVPLGLDPVDAAGEPPSFVITAGSTLPIFVDVVIPPDARPGLYRGDLVMRDARLDARRGPGRPGSPAGSVGSAGETRTTLELRVVDIFFPSEPALAAPTRVQIGPLVAALTDRDPSNLALALEDVEVRRVIREVFSMFREHGLSPYTEDVRPTLTHSADGGILLDWALYDAVCGPLIEESRSAHPGASGPAAWWPLPVDSMHPDPVQYGGSAFTATTAPEARPAVESASGAPAYRRALGEYAAAVAAHFAEKGWLSRAFIWPGLPRTANPRPGELDEFRRFCEIVRAAVDVGVLAGSAAPGAQSPGGGVPIASQLIPQPMVDFGWFDHAHGDVSTFVDIWATPARYRHGPTMARQRLQGKRTLLSPDRPPFSGSLAVEAPPVHARSLGWQAFLEEQDGLHIGAATDWPPGVPGEPIRERSQRSDRWLIYPGRALGIDGPLPSVRLKQLRQGLNDYRYLRILKEAGRPQTARLLARSLIKATGTDCYGDNFLDPVYDRVIDDPAAYDLARSILVEEALAAVGAKPDEELNSPQHLTAWSTFLAACRSIEIQAESVRLSIAPLPSAALPEAPPPRSEGGDRAGSSSRRREGRYRLTFEVSVRNDLPAPVSGRLGFGPLPLRGRAAGGPVTIESLPEFGLVRRPLTAVLVEPPPCDLYGHYAQPIHFDAGSSGRAECRAVVSMVRVARAPGPVLIDGDLSDWVPSEGNVAGDFRRVGPAARKAIAAADMPARGEAGQSWQAERAASQTVAYLCADAKTLYIGIHAESPPPAEGAPQPAVRNVVDYEDLVPVGEDLVEILLEPTRAGTAADDLYHIVLKAGGGVVLERGVAMEPAIGRAAPWPAKPPSYSVVRTGAASGWSAELAIPLDTFGQAGRESRVWGFNVARLEPRRGEYSDWARAGRYCYDPRTLGNLVWPE